jgi:hypothetical protein
MKKPDPKKASGGKTTNSKGKKNEKEPEPEIEYINI